MGGRGVGEDGCHLGAAGWMMHVIDVVVMMVVVSTAIRRMVMRRGEEVSVLKRKRCRRRRCDGVQSIRGRIQSQIVVQRRRVAEYPVPAWVMRPGCCCCEWAIFLFPSANR